MAIESIGRVAQSEATSQQAGVNLEDFLNIFLTQLNFQDPLEPVDNREFLAQLAQFSSLELANRSNENMEGLLDVTSLNQAVSLLGKEVTYTAENGATVAGTVIAMELDGQNPVLQVKDANGDRVPVSPTRVSLVKNPSSL